MKLSKEIKIGLVSIATVLAFVVGANFLKGRNLLKPESTYFVVYDHANGLTESCAVFLNGMKVGRVEKLTFLGKNDPRILVRFVVNENIELPLNTVVSLGSADLLGTKMLDLLFSPEPQMHQANDTLTGAVKADMLSEITGQIIPLKDKVEHLVLAVDTLVGGMNALFNEQTRQRLQSSIAHLQQTMTNLQQLSADAENLLASQKNTIEKIIGNFGRISDDLAKAEVGKTVEKLSATLAQVDGVVKKIQNGEGSMGMLVQDKKLYEELAQSAENLSKLLADIQKNPKRYVSISVFGGKNKDK